VAPRPVTRRYAPAPSSGPLASGPYGPSPAALAAGARARQYAAQTTPSPTMATSSTYAPRPGQPAATASSASRQASAPAYSHGYQSTYRPPASSYGASPPPPRVDVAVAGRGRFIWPVRGAIISPFGAQGVGRRNDGIDIKSAQGTVVRAAAAGEVVYAGDQVPGFGNLVLVKHADGWVTAYAHLERVSVQMRQTIAQGQEVGEVGNTGGVADPQLHFEIRYAPSMAEKARPVDPLLVLPG
ncbi:MAG: M23 family metallopeptidase, partial [Caulobacteraceae bacterium]